MAFPRQLSLFIALLRQELGSGVYIASTTAPDDPPGMNKIIVTSEDEDDIDPESAWRWIISITCASKVRSEAEDLAWRVRELMTQFMNDGAAIAGKGQVGFVVPTMKPSRTDSRSQLNDKELYQYTAAYRVTLHLF